MSDIPPKYRNPIYHFRGNSTFPSDYTLTDKALQQWGVSRELFGSTTVILSETSQFNVKDYQYAIAKDENGVVTQVGMYILPVSNNSFVPDPSGAPVDGSRMVDDLIRKKQGLKPEDEIYALISYMHPELNKGNIAQLSSTDKSQLGFTHLGAYLGKGQTSNSPVAYHDHRFGCDPLKGTDYGYPCNVHLVSLSGADQAVFNRNCQLVDMLVSHGLEFPGNYQNSMFRPVYLNAALMYYRDWLMQEDYLINDPTWYFYCAANKLTVLNIACNLPHNPKSFQEVYGAEEGQKVWAQFLNRYTNVTGFDFYYYKGLETDFAPLWKLEGLTPADITPFTLADYQGYDQHYRLGTPYTGPEPVMPPKGVVCCAQTTADVVYEFEQIYADYYDAGMLTSIGVIWGFMQPVMVRTGISELGYLRYALVFFQLLTWADARVNATKTPTPVWGNNPWFLATYPALIMVFGGTNNSPSDEQIVQQVQALMDEKWDVDKAVQTAASGQTISPETLAFVSIMPVLMQWEAIMKGGTISRADAYDEFMESAKATFEEARDYVVKSPDKIEYNILPASFNLIVNGLYAKNDLVNVETICTAVDVSEIQLVNKK